MGLKWDYKISFSKILKNNDIIIKYGIHFVYQKALIQIFQANFLTT